MSFSYVPNSFTFTFEQLVTQAVNRFDCIREACGVPCLTSCSKSVCNKFQEVQD